MSKKLENFIKENKGDFDDWHPSPDLWNRLEQATTPFEKKQVKVVSLITKYAVAAALAGIIVISSISIVNKHKIPDFNNGLVTTDPPAKTNPVVTPDNKKNQVISTNDNNVAKTTIPVSEKEIKPNYKRSSKQTLADTKQDNGGYQEDYVIINGKPVKDEEEALKITEQSLNTLASNINEGADKMKNLKYMAVNF